MLSFERRGHIPTFMLIVYAIILIGAAWFSFFSISWNFDNRDVLINSVVTQTDYQSNYIQLLAPRLVDNALLERGAGDFEVSFNESLKAVSERTSKVSDVKTNFFGKIRSGEYELNLENGIYVLIVRDVSVYSESGPNKVTRTFNIRIKFNQSSVLS